MEKKLILISTKASGHEYIHAISQNITRPSELLNSTLIRKTLTRCSWPRPSPGSSWRWRCRGWGSPWRPCPRWPAPPGGTGPGGRLWPGAGAGTDRAQRPRTPADPASARAGAHSAYWRRPATWHSHHMSRTRDTLRDTPALTCTHAPVSAWQSLTTSLEKSLARRVRARQEELAQTTDIR